MCWLCAQRVLAAEAYILYFAKLKSKSSKGFYTNFSFFFNISYNKSHSIFIFITNYITILIST